MKTILIGLVVTLVLIFGGVFWLSKTGQSATLAQNEDARVSVDKTSYDWGTIGIKNGKVKAEFSLTNTGSSPLELANISTSCVCTTAQLEIVGKRSPYFGMHQKSAWTGRVESGQSAKLVVEFDPAFHGPEGVGAITRQVEVETNDPSQKLLTFVTTAIVTK
jgi:hypothetical protein